MSLVRVTLIALLCGVMSSCYPQEINLKVEADQSAVYSPDSSAIYFVAKASAWKKGKNIWFIMPIEGQAKYLHNNLSLYHYQIQEQKISQIFDLGEIPYALSGWEIVLIPLEHAVFMTISPLGGWDDSRRHGVQELRKMLDRVFIIDNTGKLSDAVPDFPDDNLREVNISNLDSMVRALPYATFGLDIREIAPNSDRGYMNALTSLDNTPEYRRIVIEQVVSQKDKKTIRRIYERMKKSVNRLSGDEKSDMERLTRKNFERLEKLMEEQ